MTEEEALDFHIDANLLRWSLMADYGFFLFDEVEMGSINGYHRVKDDKYDSIADVYSVFYSYFSDEVEDNASFYVFDYNGGLYVMTPGVGGWYNYDGYNYTVRAVENGFEIDINYVDEYNDVHETNHIMLEDGIYVVTDFAPVLPP